MSEDEVLRSLADVQVFGQWTSVEAVFVVKKCRCGSLYE